MSSKNNMEEFITILMPAYNAEKYIQNAIESILCQSHSRFEFLIIDDGSTDGTVNIICSYDDARIRLICHEENKGLRFTLNEGIALSSYELIARMDADDISHPWRLEKQVNYMIANPECAMVDSWVKIMDKNGKFVRSEGIYSRYVYFTLTFECCIYHSAIMFRKGCVESIGGYLLDYAEDYDLFWRISRMYKIHTIEEPLLWYRVHDQNLNTVTKKQEYDEFLLQVWKNNIQYYFGNAVQIPEEYMACYRYDFDPLLKKEDLHAIRNSINLLQKLSDRILATENPNRNVKDIRFISEYKKKYILKEYGKLLSVSQMVKILLHYRQSSLIIALLIYRIKYKVFRIIRVRTSVS